MMGRPSARCGQHRCCLAREPDKSLPRQRFYVSNHVKVRFRPELYSSGCNRSGFQFEGSLRQTSTSLGFKMDFFPQEKKH